MLGTGDAQWPPPRPAKVDAAPERQPRAPRWTNGRIPGEVGVWVFILGDLLVFAMFFGVFMVERGEHLREFRAGRDTLHTPLGVANTLLLLTGSILVVLAMRAAREGLGRRMAGLVLGALATGGVFLVDKAIEYGALAHTGLPAGSRDFYTLFFVFTGIHALHLIIGMGGLVYLRHLMRKPELTGTDLATMEVCASFWHLVDLLWLVLFALFYLVA